MGSPRRQPQSTSSPQRRLDSSLPVPAQPNRKTHSNKLLCKTPQEQLPVGGIASAVRQKCCRVGSESTVPGFLQPVISGTQTQQPVATYLRPEHTEQLSEKTIIQNGDPRDCKDLPPRRGVGDLHRFQRCILPYTNKQPVQEVHAFSGPEQELSIQSTALWSVHSPHGVYSSGQRGQISGNETGYKNPPVPRRVVGQSQIPPNLSATHTNFGSSLSRIGLASEQGKIRAGTHTGLQLCRLPVQSEKRQGLPKPRTLANLTDKDMGHYVKSSVSGPAINVLDWFTDCHRKTSTSGPFTYETHTVASQKQLESTRDTGKDYPHSQITPPTSKMVAGGKQCYHRSTITPTKTCAADLYRRIKRRVGRSLKRAHGKGKLVTSRKQTAHKLSRVKSSSPGIKKISSPLYQHYSPHSYRQHYSGCLHKQGRWNEVGPLVCPTMENSDLVYQETGYSQSLTHPRPSECDSRETIQTGPDHSNRMVPQSRNLPSNMSPVVPTHCGPVCHQVQQQATTVCLTGSRPPGMGSGCSQPVMGRTGSIRLPTSSHLGQSYRTTLATESY